MRVIPQWIRGHDDQGCRGSHRCSSSPSDGARCRCSAGSPSARPSPVVQVWRCGGWWRRRRARPRFPRTWKVPPRTPWRPARCQCSGRAPLQTSEACSPRSCPAMVMAISLVLMRERASSASAWSASAQLGCGRISASERELDWFWWHSHSTISPPAPD